RNRPFGECPLLREEQTSKICCLRSTSTGTRRVVRPSGRGGVNSLARRGCGPVVLVHTQNFRLPIRKAHLGTTSDTRLFSGEKRTSHFKRVKSVQDPLTDLALLWLRCGHQEFCTRIAVEQFERVAQRHRVLVG